jgi:hypothetical protein
LVSQSYGTLGAVGEVSSALSAQLDRQHSNLYCIATKAISFLRHQN